MAIKRLWLIITALVATSSIFPAPLLKIDLQNKISHLKNAKTHAKRAEILRAILKTFKLPGSREESAAIIRGDITIKQPLIEQFKYETFGEFIAESDELTAIKKECAQELNNNDIDLDLDPSEALLLVKTKQKKHCKKYFNKNTKAQNVFNKALKKSKQLNKQGYLTLYHACMKEIYAIAYFDTKLMELTHGKRPDYLKLRQPIDSYTPIENPSITRNYFLKNGTPSDHNPYDRYHLLCANHALTGNLNNWGECTAHFFAKNDNISMPSFNLKTLFEQYGLGKYYEKYEIYKKPINDILKTIDGGILLQLAFSPELATKTIYPARPCGPQATITINKQQITDAAAILHALQHNPFYVETTNLQSINELQWRVILTDDILLNPNSAEVINGDFKVFAYSMDQDKLDELHQAIDQIIELII